MIANTEQAEMTPASTAAEPKATKTARAAKRGANVAPKKGKSGKKATPAKKAPKPRKGEKKGGLRPRRQQGRQDSGVAEAAGWRHVQGADESLGLAGAFRAWVPVRDHPQEDGPKRRFHQGRGRRAHLLRQRLTSARNPSAAGPGPGGFSSFDVLKHPLIGQELMDRIDS